MNRYFVHTVLCVLFLAGAAGCNFSRAEKWNPEPVIAVRSFEVVKIDGRLDDPVWNTAPRYHLDRNFAWEGGPLLKNETIGPNLRESGFVQVAWDDRYLYIAFFCVDSDVEVREQQDQQRLYSTGDLGEVFIKPANADYYWENYIAPSGNKSSLFFPSRGLFGLTDITDKNPMQGLNVAAVVHGTLNNWADTDQGWTGEIAIPIAELEQFGISFTQAPWTIFFGRYNYSLSLPAPELSCYPVVPARSFHLTEYYPKLILQGSKQ